MSSSRVQMSFTGRPAALAATVAWVTKSASPRRPNPPPRYIVWTRTRAAGIPSTAAAEPAAEVHRMDPDTRTRDPQHCGGRVLRTLRRLRAAPYVAAGFVDAYSAIHRFHAG